VAWNRAKILKVGGIAMGVGVLLLGVLAWRTFRVDALPAELPAMDATVAVADVTLEASIGNPDLRLGDLAGSTAFFVVVGRDNFDEAKTLTRALDRWTFPETTRGFIVADTAGFAMFRDKIDELMGLFAKEERFPMYADYDGDILTTFKLAKGHVGFVVLGPDGAAKLRNSGPMDDDQVEEVRALLDAREPEPGAAAPPFEVGELNHDTCKGTTCAIVFLGSPVRRGDVPGVDGGFEGNREASWKQMQRAELRLASTLMRSEPRTPGGFKGVVVGVAHECEFPGFAKLDTAEAARTALGVGVEETAVFVFDSELRQVASSKGLIPRYQWQRIADVLNLRRVEEGEEAEAG